VSRDLKRRFGHAHFPATLGDPKPFTTINRRLEQAAKLDPHRTSEKPKGENGDMSNMTWKRKLLGLGASLAVLATLALSSGADSWGLFLIVYTGHGR
jgi:hypothetical protein